MQDSPVPTNASRPTLFRQREIYSTIKFLCDQKQTLNYLFVSCPDVQSFWQGFSRWWKVTIDDFIVLNGATIF